MTDMNLTEENFNCIQEDNSQEARDAQWENSNAIFEEFEKYLKNKGLSEELIDRHLRYSVFFAMHYLFVYADEQSMLEVNETTIKTFLGNWYIRKTSSPNMPEIKKILSAIYELFEFIHNQGFILEEELEEIKNVCKDKKWFDYRLKTYHTAQGEAFRRWIEEYNYDW